MATPSSSSSSIRPLSRDFFSLARLPIELSPSQHYKTDPVQYLLGFIDQRTRHILLRVNKNWNETVKPLCQLVYIETEDYIPVGGSKHFRVMRSFTRAQIQEIEKTGLVIPFPAGKCEISLPRLGQGSFGEFCIAREVGKKYWCGVKITLGDRAVENEAMIQKALTGKPHILPAVHLTKAIHPTRQVALYQFMKLAGLGSTDKLEPILSRCDPLFKDQVLFYIAEGLLTGLASMHTAGYCHLDVKPDNLAIAESVQLIDFGCSAPLRRLRVREKNGDMAFFSPERWLAESFPEHPECDGIKIDSWAAGLTLLGLAGHNVRKLFRHMRSIANYKKRLADVTAGLSQYVLGQRTQIKILFMPPADSIWDLINQLLHPNPRERLSPERALRHPWITGMPAKTPKEKVVGYLREAIQAEKAAVVSKNSSSIRSPQELPLPALTSYVKRSIQEIIEKRVFTCSPETYTKAAPQLVLQGSQGVGKSSLLAHFIHDSRIKHEFDLRLWFRNADQPESLNRQYLTLALELGLIRETESIEAAIRKVHRYLSDYPARHHNKQWIAVFEDVGDPIRLAPYLPSRGGQIMISTRSSRWRDVIQMDAMSPREAHVLVENLLMRRDPRIPDLCNVLCNLPIAIVKACAYIRSYQIDIATYIKQLHRRPAILDLGDQLFGKAMTDSIVDIWSIRRYIKLEGLPPSIASRLFSFLSFSDQARTEACSRSLSRIVKQVPTVAISSTELERFLSYFVVRRNRHFSKQKIAKVVVTIFLNRSLQEQLTKYIAERFKLLMHLDLSTFDLASTDRLLPLLSKCLNIYQLRLGAITDRSLTSLTLPELLQLDLRTCDKITDIGLTSIARNCPKLQYLNLSGCSEITDHGFASLTLPELLRLDLWDCNEITDTGLTSIARNCPKLQHLDLTGCYKITDRGLASLNLRELLQLNLKRFYNITDTGLTSIARNCPKLQHLDLTECYKITDHGLASLILPELLRLDLLGCNEITDTGLTSIARNCPKLQHLDLTGCYKIKDRGLASLTLRELLRLDLERCSSITDTGLTSIARNCPKLQHLVLSGCSGIKDRGLASLILPELLRLDLKWSNEITDTGLGSIARNCPKLQRLNLSFCSKITQSGIMSYKAINPSISISIEMLS